MQHLSAQKRAFPKDRLIDRSRCIVLCFLCLRLFFTLVVVIEAFGRFFNPMFFSYVFTIFVQSYHESLIFELTVHKYFGNIILESMLSFIFLISETRLSFLVGLKFSIA